MNEVLTIEKVRELTEHMRKHHIPPSVVKTQHEANIMTAKDKDTTGHKWEVGEEYYELQI